MFKRIIFDAAVFQEYCHREKDSNIAFFVNLQSKYLWKSTIYASCAYKCENANAFAFFKLKKSRQNFAGLDHFIDICNVRSSLHYSQD